MGPNTENDVTAASTPVSNLITEREKQAIVFVPVGILIVIVTTLFVTLGNQYLAYASSVAAFFLILSLTGAFIRALEATRKRELQIDAVEREAHIYPERPQLAWDLARIKLESYLDRNLSQVKSIYWLTMMVITCGFAFVMYGLYQAANHTDKLPVSIIASSSGVLISFIGGSFLVIYRSILAQSRDYVTVLERINAVGMAVQVIASIPDRSPELKDSTTADLAKQLLGLYAVQPSPSNTSSANKRVRNQKPTNQKNSYNIE